MTLVKNIMNTPTFVKRKLLQLKYNIEKRNILEVKLQGGLCNKIYCLIAACEIAQKNNLQILEPEFGWRKKILFSDIYDIDYFNLNMEKHFGGQNILITMDTVLKEKLERRIRYDEIEKIDLWAWSEKKTKTFKNKQNHLF